MLYIITEYEKIIKDQIFKLMNDELNDNNCNNF